MIDIRCVRETNIKCSTRGQKIWIAENAGKLFTCDLGKLGIESAKMGNMGYPYFRYGDFAMAPSGRSKSIPFEESILYPLYTGKGFSSFLDYKLSFSKNKNTILEQLKETNPSLLVREKLKRE